MMDLFSVFSNFIPYLALTAGLMIFSIILLYFLGRLLDNKQMVATASIWVGDFFENLIVMVLILFIYSFSSVVVGFLTSSGGIDAFGTLKISGSDPIEGVIEVIDKLFKEYIYVVKINAEIYHVIEYVKGLKETWGFPGVSFSLNFYNASDYYEGVIQWALFMAGVILTTMKFQQMTLVLVKYLAYIAIVFALIFRFLNIFKDVANQIIAIALTYSIIFPSIYVLLLAVYKEILLTVFGLNLYNLVGWIKVIYNVPLFNFIISLGAAFFPLIAYMGPIILKLIEIYAVMLVAVFVIPTTIITFSNAFVNALIYMLNLEYRGVRL